MELPEYEGLIDKWKIDLIKSRAKLYRFRKHELPDVLQEVVLEVLDFEYDPDNGAKEASALTAIIDRRLAKLQRSEIRYRGHVERKGWTMSMFSPEGVDACGIDVRAVLAELPEQEQAICRMVAAGYTHIEIGKALGLSRKTVHRTLPRLRERFEEVGLSGWVRP